MSTPEQAQAAPVARSARPSDVLVQGLRKAVANPDTEWVDANIVRLLLDHYDAASAHPVPPVAHAKASSAAADPSNI